MVYTSLLMGGASKVQGVYLSALWAADLREFNCTVVMRISSKRIPSEPGLCVYTRINIEKGSETDNIPTESFSWRRETSVLALALFTRSRVRVQITAARGGRRASLPLRNPRPTFARRRFGRHPVPTWTTRTLVAGRRETGGGGKNLSHCEKCVGQNRENHASAGTRKWTLALTLLQP